MPTGPRPLNVLFNELGAGGQNVAGFIEQRGAKSILRYYTSPSLQLPAVAMLYAAIMGVAVAQSTSSLRE